MSESKKIRIHRSREEWRRLMEKQSGSELTQSTFCRERSLSVGSFRNWEHRLAAETPTEPWVELGKLDKAEAAGWGIELALGDGVCLHRC